MWHDLLGYAGVFAAAAMPWVELIIVIPVAIAAGMNPVLVGIIAFAGNAIPVAGIVLAHRQMTAWWHRRRGTDYGEEPKGWRRRLSTGVMARYGVPGLALVAPATIGIHVATLIALALGVPRTVAATWLIASLAAWAAATTVLAVAGVSLFE